MEYLIPQEWFIGQPQWLLLMVTAVAVVALAKGADWLVDGASGLAYRLGIPTVIVGATIVSLGTTSPEAAVSVMAAWSGEPGLAGVTVQLAYPDGHTVTSALAKRSRCRSANRLAASPSPMLRKGCPQQV